jgi:subtilisin family serine protease
MATANAEPEASCDPGVTNYIEQTPFVVSQLGLEHVWQISTGKGVIVAVVDSGVSARNAHLPTSGASPALMTGADFIDPENDNPRSPISAEDFTGAVYGDGRIDLTGHGTHIAGQIAARPIAGSALVGVAKEARILPVRVQGAGNPLAYVTAHGIRWAADQGAKIIVVAQSTPEDTWALRTAVTYATQRGALVVASAGNNYDGNAPAGEPRYPAGYPEVLGVTAIDTDGLPSSAVAQGPQVDIAAPGQAIITTFFNAGDCVIAIDKPSTSYATAYVAGVAALIAAKYPSEGPVGWKYRLLATASRPIAQDRDDSIGWGIISPLAALRFVNDGRAVGPPNPKFDPPPSVPPTLMPRPSEPAQIPADTKLALTIGLIGAFALLGAALVTQRLIATSRRSGHSTRE